LRRFGQRRQEPDRSGVDHAAAVALRIGEDGASAFEGGGTAFDQRLHAHESLLVARAGGQEVHNSAIVVGEGANALSHRAGSPKGDKPHSSSRKTANAVRGICSWQVILEQPFLVSRFILFH
jgi:hypothetical protein